MPPALLASADATPVQQGLRLRVPSALTGDALSIHEGLMQPGDCVPLHTHETADQLLYVVSGSVRVQVGDDVSVALEDDFVFKPRQVPHGFANIADTPAKLIEITLSPDFERFLAQMAIATDAESISDIERQFGMTFHA